MVTVHCSYCGKQKTIFQSQLSKTGIHYCNRKCLSANRKGTSRDKGFTDKAKASTVPCDNCGKLITKRNKDLMPHNFCSRACFGLWQRNKIKPISSKIEVKCAYCGKTKMVFPSRLGSAKKYCNEKCHHLDMIKIGVRVKKNCVNCGKEYETTIHQLAKRDSKYCSRECKHESRRKTLTHKSYYWRTIIKQIRNRDNYTCQKCGIYQKSPGLHVHHILPARLFGTELEQIKIANNPRNLVCLCASCHKQLDILIAPIIDMVLNDIPYYIYTM